MMKMQSWIVFSALLALVSAAPSTSSTDTMFVLDIILLVAVIFILIFAYIYSTVNKQQRNKIYSKSTAATLVRYPSRVLTRP